MISRGYACKQLIGSPFCDVIKQMEPSTKFNPSKCLDYIGTTNPISHVLQFKQTMGQVGVTRKKKDVMMCKAFAATHHDSA